MTSDLAVLGNETAKSLRNAWTARTGVFFELMLIYATFFGLVLFIGHGRIQKDLLAPTFLGLLIVILMHQQVVRMFWGVLHEIQAGTIEQVYLSPVPSALIIIARQAAVIIEAAAVTFLLGLPTGVTIELAWGLGIPLHASSLIQALVPITVTVVNGAGLSMIIVALTLKFRRIELLVELIYTTAFIFSGMLLPLSQMNPVLATFSRLVYPMAQPLEFVRAILLHSRSLTDSGVRWGLVWLLAQPVILVTTGVVLFTITDKAAKRAGTLGRY